MSWELFYHEADEGIRGEGETLAEAFEQAAIALTAVVTEPELVTPSIPVTIEAIDDDPEFLFLAFLNAIIFEMAVRRMLFHHVDVDIQGSHLTAVAHGEPVDITRHQPSVEVKGATATELVVGRKDGHWRAQCVVDV
mgnify:CR=1 FL=1